jgi:hypothetical protein
LTNREQSTLGSSKIDDSRWVVIKNCDAIDINGVLNGLKANIEESGTEPGANWRMPTMLFETVDWHHRPPNIR